MTWIADKSNECFAVKENVWLLQQKHTGCIFFILPPIKNDDLIRKNANIRFEKRGWGKNILFWVNIHPWYHNGKNQNSLFAL